MKKMSEGLIIQTLNVPNLVLMLISNKLEKLRLSGKLLQQHFKSFQNEHVWLCSFRWLFFLWSNMCGQPQFLSCWKWSVVKFGCYLIEQIEGKWLSWIMMVLWCIFDLQIIDVYWRQCKKNHSREYKPTCSGLYSSTSFFKPLGSSLWTTG